MDGAEDVHCPEDRPGTALAEDQMSILPTEGTVPERRYSAVYGTDLEIFLRFCGPRR